ncbi:MAG: hypothetical protein RLZZ206_1201 [Cyanobacteriota bacterium]|jgi:hypothetical protein
MMIQAGFRINGEWRPSVYLNLHHISTPGLSYLKRGLRGCAPPPAKGAVLRSHRPAQKGERGRGRSSLLAFTVPIPMGAG